MKHSDRTRHRHASTAPKVKGIVQTSVVLFPSPAPDTQALHRCNASFLESHAHHPEACQKALGKRTMCEACFQERSLLPEKKANARPLAFSARAHFLSSFPRPFCFLLANCRLRRLAKRACAQAGTEVSRGRESRPDRPYCRPASPLQCASPCPATPSSSTI